MKSKTIMNAFDLYYALESANTAFRASEIYLGANMSERKMIINKLKDQVKSLNTTGNINIIMKET